MSIWGNTLVIRKRGSILEGEATLELLTPCLDHLHIMHDEMVAV